MAKTTLQLSLDLIDQPQAQSALTPFLPALRSCFVTAWQNWDQFGQLAPELQYVLTPRTRAGFINDHICQQVKVTFAGMDGVAVHETNGLVLMTIFDKTTGDELISLRFKKLNRDLLSSNIPTKQQVQFAEQLPIPGLPSVTRLTAGYQLDLLQSTMSDLWITCPVGSNVVWAYSFMEEEVAGAAIEIIEHTPAAAQARPRVKAINVKKQEAKSSNEVIE